MALLLTALLAVAQAPEPWVFYGYHVSDGGDSRRASARVRIGVESR